MRKRIIYLIAFLLAGVLLVSCGEKAPTAQISQAALQENSQLTEQIPETNPEPVSESDTEPVPETLESEDTAVPPLYHAVIQYGHPDLITDNDGVLKAYIRYPQADGFADAVIAEWARATYENALETVNSLRETNAEAEGEINVQFDSYLSPDGGFAGVIEQGMFMNTGLAHSEDVIKTFNLDIQNQVILANEDILNYSRVSDILVLLREKLLTEWPESADYVEEASEEWLNYIAVGPDGVIVVLERGVCLPAYLGSQRVNLPYGELGDLLLMGGRQAESASEIALVTSEMESETTPVTSETESETESETPSGTSETEPETTTPPEPPVGDIDPSKPMIALTFDDGPSKYTPQILDLLEQHGGRATFCVIGNLVDSGKETVKRAADMGCEIVGHSWDHRDLTKLSAEEIKAELADTNRVIESVIGTAPSLYRPPYGAVNNGLKEVSRDMDLRILYWSVDTLDWKTRNADAVHSAVMKDAADRAIVLNHDIYGSTVEAMDRIIPELIAQGYQLVTVSELFQYSGISTEAGTVYYSGK